MQTLSDYGQFQHRLRDLPYAHVISRNYFLPRSYQELFELFNYFLASFQNMSFIGVLITNKM